jgi:glycolate dehydrogenase FAD-binding subunit
MTIAGSAALTRLAEIAGAANVVTEPPQLSAYQIGSQAPVSAVRPGTPEEIAEIVKFAATEKLAIIPCSARTKLAMGAPPRQYDLALDMTRLDRIVAYDPADLTLSVEPGIPLQRLAGVLAGHRQFLPLAVPFLSRATAGGTIASGVDSPLRQAYGSARDYLLGLEFVTGDGVRAKSGGVVVKNVAGFDLHKLMIGALGTLGVITKVNFRTFPAPADTRVFTAACETAGGVLDLRRRVAQSPLRPLTMEILNPRAVEMLSSALAARIEPGPAPVDRLPKQQWAFLATFAGTGEVTDRYARELTQLAGLAACTSTAVHGDEKNAASFGRLREFIPIALESSPATTIVKLSVLPTRMMHMLDAVAAATEENELLWAAMAGALGVIYAALLPASRDEHGRKRVAQASNRLLAACAELGGNAAIPWCPSEWKNDLNIRGRDRPDFEQMRKLKTIFDPAGILSPGRFVGGI